jgi:hypothetical protein
VGKTRDADTYGLLREKMRMEALAKRASFEAGKGGAMSEQTCIECEYPESAGEHEAGCSRADRSGYEGTWKRAGAKKRTETKTPSAPVNPHPRPVSCGAGGCVVARPQGMHVNGPCRCYGNAQTLACALAWYRWEVEHGRTK